MRAIPNPSRPDIAFMLVWIAVVLVYLPLDTVLTPPFDPWVAAMLAFNILTAPLIYYVVSWIVGAKMGPRAEVGRPVLDRDEMKAVERFLGVITLLWLASYVATIIYSGGVPLYWYLIGDSRSYFDFGLTSIGGLANMLRNFAAILCVLLLLTTSRKIFGVVWAALLLSSLADISRSGSMVFLAQSLAMFLLMRTLKLRHVFAVIVVVIFASGTFIVLGGIRGIVMNASDFGDVAVYFGDLPVGIYWVWAYLVSPLGNLNYAVSMDMPPLYFPYFTFATLVPSVIRIAISVGRDYPIPLLSESLNATSMYAPLYADFGIGGATIFMTVFQIVACYVYAVGRRGKLLYALCYPALFSSIVLSIFFIFAITPGVVCIPLLCIWLKRFVERNKARVSRLAATPGAPIQA